MIFCGHENGRCPQAGPRNPGSTADTRGAERTRWRESGGCRQNVESHKPNNEQMAGGLSPWWVGRIEGETTGGASAEVGRKKVEMAVQYDNSKEPFAAKIPVGPL